MTPSTASGYAHQTLVAQSPNGQVQFSMDDLSYYVQYALRISINYGTQLGASIILLVLLSLLTHSKKRRSPIYILNTVSLVLNIIRLFLGCAYYTGPFYDPYVYLTADYTSIGNGDKAVSIAADVFTLMLLMCMLTSLVFQIKVISVVNTGLQRLCLVALSVSVALVAVGFRFALVVLVSKATVELVATVDLAWLVNATNITMTISICVFSSIFIWKLGAAIKKRRQLGLDQFGPMQAIFVMSTQTLIVPAIFSIFQYIGEPIMLQSVVLTTVVLFLPLSAMWAAAQADQENATTAPSYNRYLIDKSVTESCSTPSTLTGSSNGRSLKASHTGSMSKSPR